MLKALNLSLILLLSSASLVVSEELTPNQTGVINKTAPFVVEQQSEENECDGNEEGCSTTEPYVMPQISDGVRNP